MDIEVLKENRLMWWCEQAGIPAEGRPALLAAAQQICADDELQRIFSAFYEKTTLRGEWHREWSPLPMDPIVEDRFGSRASLFYFLGYMACLPQTALEYQRRGISNKIFRETIHDFAFYYVEDSDVRGSWCFDHFPWIWRHVTCEIFRLGRLQFMLAPFESGVKAFRSSETGEYLLLADPQVELRADGYAEGAGGQPSGGDTWRPVFEEQQDGWKGNPVSPYGYALREPVFLPKTRWQLALQRHDTILDIHIPRGTSLTTEECSSSFHQAFDFFAYHAPDREILASYCHTWFFTPQLQQLLGPVSSLVRFQREFYLFPFPGGPGFLWTYVFGGKITDPTTAPRDTSLRSAVLDWLAAGKELFDLPGVMFHDYKNWGSQPYMSRWDQQDGKYPEA